MHTPPAEATEATEATEIEIRNTGGKSDLVVRSADGVLRKARNLCVGCLIEAVRSADKTIGIDTINRVLLQPHWQKEADLADY